MKKIIKNKNQFGSLRWLIFASFSILLSFGITSCDSLVEVIDPDIVTPESLNSETGIQTLKAGSLGDFAVAMSGSAAGHGATVGLIPMSGLMSDEYDYSGTFPTRREGDTRNLQNINGTMNTIYSNLHRARAGAEATIDLAIEFGGVAEVESEMHSIVGYSYLMFAETFCGGVPFSKVPSDGGDIIFGEPLTTEQMFRDAITWFDQASAKASGNNDLLNLAKVGRARALLGLGDISAAATEASSVPDGFVYDIEHSINSRRQENGVYIMSTVRNQYSVAEGKGGNGQLYRSAMDPRVPWDGGDAFGQDDSTLYYNQLIYLDSNASIIMASGTEARLIQAEAAADLNDAATVEEIHNILRATMSLGDLDFSGLTGDDLLKAHFAERAFWLFSTGHRHGDLRRMVDVYNMPPSDVFPWGEYFKGGNYSENIKFPIPESESNNPNYVGCLN